MSAMPERVWIDPVVRLHDDEGGWWYFDKRQVDESPYVPESRLLAAEARAKAMEDGPLDYMSGKCDRLKEENATLRAERDALRARVREVEVERDAIHADYVSKVHKVLDLRAERDALVAEVARYKELLLTMEMPDA